MLFARSNGGLDQLHQHAVGIADKHDGLAAHGDLMGNTVDEDIRVFLNMLAYGRLDITPLISHRFHYTQMTEAYEMVWKGDRSLTAGLIEWDD